MNACILVTGGAGFIGSNFVLDWLASKSGYLVNLDKLTYAGNRNNLEQVAEDPRHTFVHGDICDRTLVQKLLQEHRPHAIVHFAAESHVDRSIRTPEAFVRTNVYGTFNLLDSALDYWRNMNFDERSRFRFVHVSTDEVYGSLRPNDPPFTEETPYAPSSPYSASKAGSDHLVRSYHHTFGLPAITTNCSNNYGPFQFPEKLIPLMIHNALQQKSLPVYGDGRNVRDWLYVSDHCEAIRSVLELGRPGETYNIGGANELTNLEVVKMVCLLLDELRPTGDRYDRLIAFVPDRPGHDRRYAMNIAKIRRELSWSPRESFGSGLRKTVQWYLDHENWVAEVTSGAYRNWIETHYAKA